MDVDHWPNFAAMFLTPDPYVGPVTAVKRTQVSQALSAAFALFIAIASLLSDFIPVGTTFFYLDRKTPSQFTPE